MRTLALTAALATALTGTGCFISSNPPAPVGDVFLYWAFQRAAPAQPDGVIVYDANYAAVSPAGVCPESDVDTVRVESGPRWFDIACTGLSDGSYVQGAVLVDLPAGWNDVTLTGYRGGVASYRSTVQVNVPADSYTSQYVDIAGLAAPLEAFAYLSYQVPAPGGSYLTCAEASSPNLSIFIYDVVFGLLVDSFQAGCSDPLPAFAYSETLDLDDYDVRMQGRTPGGTLVFDSCTVPLAHFGSQVGASGFTATLFTSPVPTCQ